MGQTNFEKMGELIEPNWRKAMLEGNDGFYYWCLTAAPWSEVGIFTMTIIFAVLRKCCSHWTCWHSGSKPEWYHYFAFGTLSGMNLGGGINGLLALMLTSDAPGDTNQFQSNMLTFNIMTIIGATIASLPWLLAFQFIVGKIRGITTDEDSLVFHSWFWSYMFNYFWIIVQFIAVGCSWKYSVGDW